MYLSYESVTPLGDLGARLGLLYGRLGGREYRPDAIFTIEQNGWPGDWEGRTILAQTLLSRAMGREHPFLRGNFNALAEHLNEKGYRKHILPEGEFDEQQLSGHGWLIRGLCEYYDYTGDESALAMAKRMAENLFLPLRGRMGSYRAYTEGGGGASGSISQIADGWHLSSDTGCVFIPMDGLSRLWELTKDPRLGELLSEMAERFASLNLLALKAQTHASLSATRALLRMYKVSGEENLLHKAQAVFDLYEQKGMTAAFANCNWFDRPEWTEPCAIIDSFIVAMRLFEYTGDTRYALSARKIYLNGICRAQRDNGGFGCDSCPGWENGSGDFLEARMYEAYWCCTMRGGEGLPMAARFIAEEKGGVVRILLPQSARLKTETAVFTLDGAQAREGILRIKAEQGSVRCTLLLPDGSWSEEILLCEGQTAELSWDVSLHREGRRLMWGETLLGSENAPAAADETKLVRDGKGFCAGEIRFEPVADSYLWDKNEILEKKLRTLFD